MAAEKDYIAQEPRFLDGIYYFEGETITLDPKRAEAINKGKRKPALVELAGQGKPVPAGE